MAPASYSSSHLISPLEHVLPVLQAVVEGQELLDPYPAHQIGMLLRLSPRQRLPLREKTHGSLDQQANSSCRASFPFILRDLERAVYSQQF